jgi:hypothetical protein
MVNNTTLPCTLIHPRTEHVLSYKNQPPKFFPFAPALQPSTLHPPQSMAPVVPPCLPSPTEALQNPLLIRSDRSLSNPFLRQHVLKPSAPFLCPLTLDSTPKAIHGAYATFISKDDYLPGALVLAHCHHMTNSIYTPSSFSHPPQVYYKCSQRGRPLELPSLGFSNMDDSHLRILYVPVQSKCAYQFKLRTLLNFRQSS